MPMSPVRRRARAFLGLPALDDPDAMERPRVVPWLAAPAAFALALGALVLGTVEAVSASSKSDAFNSHTGTTGGVVYQDCGTSQLTPACKSLKSDYDSALRLSIVGFAAAGALAATSAVLFVRSSPHGAEADGNARAFACVPDPLARGVDCTLRF